MADGPGLHRDQQTDFYRQVYCVLGLPFDALGLGGATALVATAVQQRQACFFSTPNLNFLMACQGDAKFRDTVLRSDLSFADGMPLVWVARALRLGLHQRVAGSSLFDALRRSAGAPIKVFFFGGPEGVAQKACAALNASGGRARGVGFLSPGFGSLEELSRPEVVDRINASGADFLLVALGAHKGQLWIDRNLGRLRVPVVSHLGAVINFVAGTVERAPSRWQQWGLEWLWRIKQEPALWSRYAKDGLRFALMLATHVGPAALEARFRRVPQEEIDGAKLVALASEGAVGIALHGAWTERHLSALREQFTVVSRQPSDIFLDLSQATFLDNACVALMLLLRGHQNKAGRRLVLTGVPSRLQRSLRRLGASYLLSTPSQP